MPDTIRLLTTAHADGAALPRPLPVASPPAAPAAPTVTVHWARHQDEVAEAQRLRHAVFAGEMGARIDDSARPGHDCDRFDDFCEHLLVRDSGSGRVVGTYRLLTPAQAQRAGSLYSEGEFDLAPLGALRPRLVELGRSCVHPDWRSGGVILALWSALAGFMARNALDTMVGCASIPMRDGGEAAASVWRQLRERALAPADLQVRPHLPLPVEHFDSAVLAEPPALIQGYVRLGARVLGAPAWDPDFNTADLPMLLRMQDLPARYRRHWLGA